MSVPLKPFLESLLKNGIRNKKGLKNYLDFMNHHSLSLTVFKWLEKPPVNFIIQLSLAVFQLGAVTIGLPRDFFGDLL